MDHGALACVHEPTSTQNKCRFKNQMISVCAPCTRRCLQSPEKSTGSLGAGVRGGCELPNRWSWELNPAPYPPCTLGISSAPVRRMSISTGTPVGQSVHSPKIKGTAHHVWLHGVACARLSLTFTLWRMTSNSRTLCLHLWSAETVWGFKLKLS